MTERRTDLEALRGFAMALGIAVHASLAFYQAPWPVHDTRPSRLLPLLFLAIHGFRMPLFFLPSGYFTMLVYRRRGLASLLRRCGDRRGGARRRCRRQRAGQPRRRSADGRRSARPHGARLLATSRLRPLSTPNRWRAVSSRRCQRLRTPLVSVVSLLIGGRVRPSRSLRSSADGRRPLVARAVVDRAAAVHGSVDVALLRSRHLVRPPSDAVLQPAYAWAMSLGLIGLFHRFSPTRAAGSPGSPTRPTGCISTTCRWCLRRSWPFSSGRCPARSSFC
jgi:hypothetical protein